MRSWSKQIQCPESGIAFESASSVTNEGGSLLSLDGEMEYPIIAGIPILVPAPERYLGNHYEAVLAALAEEGYADQETVALVQDWASRDGAAVSRFEDDWSPREEDEHAPVFDAPVGESGDALRRLLAEESTFGLEAILRKHIGSQVLGHVAEIGPGGGTLSRHLAAHAESLLLADISPRPLLRLRRELGAAAVVMDAEAPALRDESFDLIVAANVVDLLDDPVTFLKGLATALRPGGKLIISTPNPWVWEGGRPFAEGLFDALGLRMTVFEEKVPWLRNNGPRDLQVLLADVVVATLEV